MKKLLEINTTANYGSTGHIAESIGTYMQSKGWLSYIAYGRHANASPLLPIKIGTNFDIYTHVLYTRLFDRHGYASNKATRKLAETIREIKPDIIHLHNIHGYYLNIDILFTELQKIGIPVVWTLHDCWSFTGHCAYFDNVNCHKWQTHCERCPQKHSYPASWLIDNSAKNYLDKQRLFTSLNNLTIVTVSQWLENLVHKSFFHNNVITTIHNGVDTNLFQPIKTTIKEQLSISNNIMLLGVANQWEPRKRLNDYIQLSKYLNDKYKIVLVGLTKKQLKHLPKNIIGLPRTASIKDLVALYSAADIVLNLSVEETFGMTTIEGFSCGTPSIVYNKTASPELITPQTGYIVEPGDFTELRNKIIDITHKGKSHYQTACRERALTQYSHIHQYEQYYSLFKSIL